MKPWKTLSRRTILDTGRFLTVEAHQIELPNGRVIDDWPWVITPNYVNVVAITPDERFLCFRQTKYSIAGVSLAPVGGYIEPGEDPLVAARRELLEETGYEAQSWASLGSYPIDGNRGVGVAYFFLARDAQRRADIHADDLEEQEMCRLSRSEIEAALDAGEFKLMPWAMIVALALRRIGRADP